MTLIESDLTIFEIGELFEKRKEGTNTNNTIDASFRPSYSISPLESCIRREERDNLQALGVILKNFLMENLGLGQYGFLRSIFGDSWSKRLRLPLEFRDLSPPEFEKYLKSALPDIRERVDILKKHLDNPDLAGRSVSLQEFISVPFNMTTQKKIIEIYDSVKDGRLTRYPHAYFHPKNSRVPRILTRYLVDDVLKVQHSEDLPEILRPKDFSEHNLGFMLGQYFAGNVEKALRHAYSVEEYPKLYSRSFTDGDVLREVFINLERIKNKNEENKK